MKRKSGWITAQDHTLCAESLRNIHTLAKCFQSPAEFALAICCVSCFKWRHVGGKSQNLTPEWGAAPVQCDHRWQQRAGASTARCRRRSRTLQRPADTAPPPQSHQCSTDRAEMTHITHMDMENSRYIYTDQHSAVEAQSFQGEESVNGSIKTRLYSQTCLLWTFTFRDRYTGKHQLCNDLCKVCLNYSGKECGPNHAAFSQNTKLGVSVSLENDLGCNTAQTK